MRKIREILRLVWVCGLSHRQASRSSGVGRTTVQEYVFRAQACRLDWQQVSALNEEELEERLYAGRSPTTGARPAADFVVMHNELCRKGVTLMLLWQEYLEAHPSGYQYSQFCEHYRRWRYVSTTLRQLVVGI
jgi:transposase